MSKPKVTRTMREVRKAQGLTIQELSEKSGVPWGTLQGIDSGRIAGNLITRQKIADALGVPLRALWPYITEEWGELFEAMKRDAKRSQDERATK